MGRYASVPNISESDKREARLDALAMIEAAMRNDSLAYNTILADCDIGDAHVLLLTLAHMGGLLAGIDGDAARTLAAVRRITVED